MDEKTSLTHLTASIVSAYLTHNALPVSEVPKLIAEVHAALARALEGTPIVVVPTEAKTPISVKKSIHNDYLICFEDGGKFKSLKRHLRSHFNMTPDQYRQKWQLPSDYPMVAPGYAKKRSTLAKSMGLGRKAVPKS